jgi:hypothetical protein
MGAGFSDLRSQGLKLVAGMPVETFIQTTPRTVTSYLIRPLRDQMMRAFREKQATNSSCPLVGTKLSNGFKFAV